MATAYVFMANGFEEIEAFTTIDVLRRAGMFVEMISVTKEEIVSGAHDVPVLCDARFEGYNLDDMDVLVLPGGMPGAGTLSDHKGVQTLVRKFMLEDKLIAAICAAPMVMGKMGLLRGKTVTCYPGFEQYLEGANVTGAPVEKDGNIITGKGPGAAFDFALKIVETLYGEAKVKELKEAMVIEK